MRDHRVDDMGMQLARMEDELNLLTQSLQGQVNSMKVTQASSGTASNPNWYWPKDNYTVPQPDPWGGWPAPPPLAPSPPLPLSPIPAWPLPPQTEHASTRLHIFEPTAEIPFRQLVLNTAFGTFGVLWFDGEPLPDAMERLAAEIRGKVSP